MKTSAIARIVIFSFVILLLVGILAVGVIGSMLGSYFKDDVLGGGTVSDHGAVLADKIRNLEIDWVSGSITIKTGDTDQIIFSETGSDSEKNTMVWKQTGNTLKIQFRQPKKFLGFSLDFSIGGEKEKDLTITIPKDWVGTKLSIDSVSAKVDVAEINVKDLDLDTVSGSINLTGSVTNVELDSVSASCTLNLSAGVKSIGMDCVSGKLTVYLPEDQGFTAEIDGLNGDINTDFAVTTSNGKQIYGDGSCEIEADCVSGDINIKKAP